MLPKGTAAQRKIHSLADSYRFDRRENCGVTNMSIYWPIALAVFADIFYQISAKSTPSTLNPFVGLTITYLVGAAVSLVIYYIVSGGGNIIEEYKSINWTSFVLGLAIVGLEAGSIYMYKVVEHEHRLHRQIHVSGIALIAVGYFLYKEHVTGTKILGIAVCLVGLFLINK